MASTECRVLVDRLKKLDPEDFPKEPGKLLALYPIRDPDNEATIFDEVYYLLNESLHKRSCKFRLFYFINTMLSSTKVPAYVIAAYMKRLSRLSLQAKPRTLLCIIKLVGNLLIRHPILISLRDRVEQFAQRLEQKHGSTCTLRNWLELDPFDEAERKDLSRSRAMDSCIWELMPLRYHSHARIAKAAAFLGDTSLLEMEFELDDVLR